MIKTFWIDLGNTILNFDFNKTVQKLHLSEDHRKKLFDFLFDSELAERIQRGQITFLKFYQKIKKVIPIQASLEEFKDAFCDIFWENTDCIEIFRKIKPSYRTVLTTNINEVHFKFLYRKFPVLREFDELVLSYEIGQIKPDKEFYSYTLDKSLCSLKEVLYIDDREDLISATKQMGIHSICYKDKSSLVKELEKHDVYLP